MAKIIYGVILLVVIKQLIFDRHLLKLFSIQSWPLAFLLFTFPGNIIYFALHGRIDERSALLVTWAIVWVGFIVFFVYMFKTMRVYNRRS